MLNRIIDQAVRPESDTESPTGRDALTEILRNGARRLLAEAVEAEVEEYLEARRDIQNENGRRAVVRNGYLPEREIVTGLGKVPVRQPRVRDRRGVEDRESFSSKILPPYLRKKGRVFARAFLQYLLNNEAALKGDLRSMRQGFQGLSLLLENKSERAKLVDWCPR